MYEKVKRFAEKVRGSKESRTLLSNFGYLSLLQVAGYVFPLITVPYLARVIGPEGYGKIGFASAVVAWFLSVVTWGFDFTATRDAARNRNDIDKVSEIFSNVIWTRLFLCCCSFIILLLLIAFIPTFNKAKIVLIFTFLLIPGHIMFPEWLFQAMERMKYITIFSLVSKLVFTCLVFVFIHKPDDYLLQPIMVSMGYLVSGILAFYIIIHNWGVRFKRPVFSKIISTIMGGFDVFINNFMPNLYNSMSTVMLGFFAGPIANGMLNAGGQIVTITQQFMNILSRTFFPFLARNIDKHKIFSRISILISFIGSFVLFVISPMFIKVLYTEDFNDAIIVSRILSVSLLFTTISNVYGTNYLILLGFERQLRNITAVFSVLGLLLGLVLIYNYSFVGAALTVSITRGLLAISTLVYARIFVDRKRRE